MPLSVRAMALWSLVLLSGCGGTPVATVEPFKLALRDVCVSVADTLTERTAQQIEANNLALRKLVGRGSQCPKAKGNASPHQQLAPAAPTPAATS